MGVSLGDLDARQMDRLRGELAETLAEQYAYPPFYDFRRGRVSVRPLDRAKYAEIEEYLRSVNYTALARTDLTSLEVRRFIERLLLRYLEVNPDLQRPRLQRRLTELRARAPRLAAAVQRGLVAYASGGAPGYGAPRQRVSWAGGPGAQRTDPHDEEHNTRVLAATLARRDTVLPPAAQSHTSAPPTVPTAAPTFPGVAAGGGQPFAPPASARAYGAPTPSANDYSPFARLSSGAQSSRFGSPNTEASFVDAPTGPLYPADAVAPPTLPVSAVAPSAPGAAPRSGARELPPDLYALYGDYLRDMQPEVAASRTTLPPAAPSAWPAPDQGRAGEQSATGRPPAGYGQATEYEQRQRQNPAAFAPAPRPADAAPLASGANGDPSQARGDKLIFWQLRYQLEAYVRRAARSYGVQVRSDDPSGVLDALRRSGHVDEADLRIAEGILALTDRVTAGATASTEDYRQALMLYLLYHRSHLGG